MDRRCTKYLACRNLFLPSWWSPPTGLAERGSCKYPWGHFRVKPACIRWSHWRCCLTARPGLAGHAETDPRGIWNDQSQPMCQSQNFADSLGTATFANWLRHPAHRPTNQSGWIASKNSSEALDRSTTGSLIASSLGYCSEGHSYPHFAPFRCWPLFVRSSWWIHLAPDQNLAPTA